MKRILAIGLLALSLGGCVNGKILGVFPAPTSAPSLNLNSSVALNTVQGVQALYGTALSGERAYKSLPLCKTGTTATLLNPCARRSIIVRLQDADLKAASAIRSMVNFVNTYPTVDATNVISAAATAVTNLQSILDQNGV